MDTTLWEKTGMDPRPWMQKFYEELREYQLVITASNLKSYIVEARIPTAAAEKFGYITTESPTPTILPQKTYIVSVNAFRIDSSLRFVYEGGRDAASLQNITITSNDVYLGELVGANDQTPLPMGTASTFPVTCPVSPLCYRNWAFCGWINPKNFRDYVITLFFFLIWGGISLSCDVIMTRKVHSRKIQE